jgi:hypothetical protein
MPTFDFIQEAPLTGVGFAYKSTTEAFYYDGTTVFPIRTAATFTATTGTGTTTLNISSVTSGTVVVGATLTGLGATRTIASFGTFDGVSGTVNLSSATTWANPTTVTATYAVDNDYPVETVRGFPYLDGTYYVMTPKGSIYGSAINNPLSWSALNVIQSQGEPDGGVYLGRQLNLLVSLGGYSAEFFYNAANAVGSPLLPQDNAFLEVGCAVAESVAQTDNTLFFMGITKQKGRGIYRFIGTTPEYLSNPFIDRLLNADDLTDVSAFCVRIGGHVFYVLYLGDIGLTLVYDSTSKQWAEWTVSSLATPSAITGAVWSNRVVTVTKTAHGYEDGDVVVIASSNPSTYDGEYTINVPTANTFTYELDSDPGTYVGSATSANYVQEPFAVASYTSGNNLDIIQDSTTGFVYLLDNGTYEDNGAPIDVLIRTFKFDAGDNKKKFTSRLEIIGDKVDSTAYVRYTNDDYQTYSQYRPVDLDSQRSQLTRLGQTRRRAYEVRHHDNVPLRLESLELTLTEGTN